MSVLYGKVRVYTTPGQTIDITDGRGITKQIITTGETYTDVALPGMEEYTLSNGTKNESVLLNIGDFTGVKFNPLYYDDLKSGVTLTEAQWLTFLNGNGIKYIIYNEEISEFLGKKVRLTNSADSTYTTWSIGGFNHDSTNDTVDLILDNNIHSADFSSSSNMYSSSAARTWLTGTYYNGFSTNVKNKLQTMTVASNGTTLNDKIKLLSFTEVNGSTGTTDTHYVTEGTRYPIFSDNASRVRTGAATYWYLRSRFTNSNYNGLWRVQSNGALVSSTSYSGSYGLVPAIRFS